MTAENGEGVVMAGLENPLDFVVNGGSPYTVGRAVGAVGRSQISTFCQGGDGNISPDLQDLWTRSQTSCIPNTPVVSSAV